MGNKNSMMSAGTHSCGILGSQPSKEGAVRHNGRHSLPEELEAKVNVLFYFFICTCFFRLTYLGVGVGDKAYGRSTLSAYPVVCQGRKNVQYTSAMYAHFSMF